jgi:VCBS repeat-containing protein
MVRNTYTVTFDLGDHGTRIGGGELVQIVPHGGTPTPPTVVVENGWIANGWDKAFDNVTSDLTVTAQYVQTYTVTFDLGDHGARTGGGELSQTVNHGDAAIEPTFTTDDGWGFTGWDTAFDNVTSDLTVTAQYVTKTYTVTFDLGNHGTRTGGGELSQMIDHGDAAVEPTLTVEDGWTRTGWDTAFNNVTADLTVTALYSANPEAVADSYTTPQDTALAVAAPGVLANDTDAESDALAAVKLTDPSHGTLALAADGSFTYTPTAGYFGPDSFTYRAKDATGESGATTVTIAVERTYALVVVSGSGSGSYAAGEEIATTAGTPPAGQVFSGWVTDPVGFGANLADAAACSTTFTMPASDVTLTATYSEAPPEWAVELTVTGAYPDVLTFGMQADATDGWDPGVDDDYPLPGPGQACLAADDLTIEVDPKSRTNGTRY